MDGCKQNLAYKKNILIRTYRSDATGGSAAMKPAPVHCRRMRALVRPVERFAAVGARFPRGHEIPIRLGTETRLRKGNISA